MKVTLQRPNQPPVTLEPASQEAPRLDESAVVAPRSTVDQAVNFDAQFDAHGGSRGLAPSAVTTRAGARPNPTHHGALGARMAALAGATLDRAHKQGQKALAQRFDEIEKLAKAGVTVRCVFDLDNTLFDTRARTLHAAKLFDQQHGTSHFADLTLDQVKLDGRDTAIALGLPDTVIEAFGTLWDVAFWDPDHLVHDLVMSPVVEIAREAERRGAVVVYLTGRAEEFVDKEGRTRGFREATRAQLERAGLPAFDEHIFLKPGPGVRTAPYKEQMLREWADDGEVGFFITEGRRDIQHVSTTMTELSCFLLDSSLERGGPACDGVPLLPPVF